MVLTTTATGRSTKAASLAAQTNPVRLLQHANPTENARLHRVKMMVIAHRIRSVGMICVFLVTRKILQRFVQQGGCVSQVVVLLVPQTAIAPTNRSVAKVFAVRHSANKPQIVSMAWCAWRVFATFAKKTKIAVRPKIASTKCVKKPSVSIPKIAPLVCCVSAIVVQDAPLIPNVTASSAICASIAVKFRWRRSKTAASREIVGQMEPMRSLAKSTLTESPDTSNQRPMEFIGSNQRPAQHPSRCIA